LNVTPNLYKKWWYGKSAYGQRASSLVMAEITRLSIISQCNHAILRSAQYRVNVNLSSIVIFQHVPITSTTDCCQ
jgi:hypothetical protein